MDCASLKVLRDRWSVMVQASMVAMQHRRRNLKYFAWQFLSQLNFFYDRAMRAPSPVQSVKTRSFVDSCNRSLRFSTFFFTELLKRGRN
jgi:hypothetical protein